MCAHRSQFETGSAGASRGFAAVSGADARVLVLGSLPGKRSLEQTEYYAQPRNAFWQLMGELVGASAAMPYAQRLERLVDARIALWDVVASAVRPGSLDSRIRADTVVVNDFVAFFAAHRNIERICFNGQTAARLFRQRVAAQLDGGMTQSCVTLPSTSPAHAGLPYAEKLRQWRAALADVIEVRAAADSAEQ